MKNLYISLTRSNLIESITVLDVHKRINDKSEWMSLGWSIKCLEPNIFPSRLLPFCFLSSSEVAGAIRSPSERQTLGEKKIFIHRV